MGTQATHFKLVTRCVKRHIADREGRETRDQIERRSVSDLKPHRMDTLMPLLLTISLMMLGVMDLHDLFGDGWLESIVGVW